MNTPILQPGQLEPAAGEIPELRLPRADLFLTRAQRFRQLAEHHALADWLHLLADLSHAQQAVCDGLDQLHPPSAEVLTHCRDYAMPPLPSPGSYRDPVWHDVLRQLAGAIRDSAPPPLQTALERIDRVTPEWLENQADLLLDGHTQGLDLALAPFIGAALQTCWTRLASQLQADQVARPAPPGLCPVCGSPPVASVIRIGGRENGLRYLHCSLCASEWHVVRAKCSHCDNSKGIAYYSVEGGNDTVRAESCPECKSYLKVMYQERDPLVDAVADDLASFALDLLMGDTGVARSGSNLLLTAGEDAA